MKEILSVFLKMGTVGFGGPIAFIGMIEHECIQKRKWFSIEEFQKQIAICKLCPGPIATLLAIRMGCLRAGIFGGLIAGLSVILPAFLMILFLSRQMSLLDQNSSANYYYFWAGLSLGALAVSFIALVQLTKPNFEKRALSKFQITSLIFINAICTYLDPSHEALYVLSSALIGSLTSFYLFEAITSLLAITLFTSCFKASLLTFGSGIAIIPVLKATFIDEHHFITEQDFLKGLALGQSTPGPLVITATYLGYAVSQTTGAIITTVGTFMPSFILGLFVLPKIENKILKNARVQYFFNWMMPAVCGAIFGSIVRLSMLTVPRFFIIAALSTVLFKFKPHPILILLGGGMAALLFQIT